MSFVPKFLILAGWMLIFRVGMVESASLIDKLAGLDQTVLNDTFRCLGDNLQTIIEHLREPTSNQTVGNCPPGPKISENISYSEKSELILSLVLDLPMNITEAQLYPILIPFVNETTFRRDMDKKKLIQRTAQFFGDLERLTSGGPASANSSKGLFSSTIAAIIAAVALRLGTITC